MWSITEYTVHTVPRERVSNPIITLFLFRFGKIVLSIAWFSLSEIKGPSEDPII